MLLYFCLMSSLFEISSIYPSKYKYCFYLIDSTIQKLKQQYNQSGGPALEVTLAEVQEDLRIRPPQLINLDEVELTNGTANGHIEQGVASSKAILNQSLILHAKVIQILGGFILRYLNVIKVCCCFLSFQLV